MIDLADCEPWSSLLMLQLKHCAANAAEEFVVNVSCVLQTGKPAQLSVPAVLFAE